ncbi:MAG: 50S ribosomal protein L9 [Candidatus Buchananbacteria bacterium RIFCSPHIGHO2_02_FULL_56_16]|uniref:Large ribosomal subunit protein bL9 n=1 Tax=Candidatus Buchananbacteria bacterium RIFCSPHIGHO2_02_FULL_56_16 TaxID=1797542 RepID=A0A1G1YDE6_9BACT|nr:MAG: 50S ribosomal protein L9 [Candidatus Buchananbacteria bacterium RIFCSPHIGHO2_02_FULL_56_16]
MKVILLKNVPQLGEQGDVKEVAIGHARNFLIPRGLAKPATPQALAELELNKVQAAKTAEVDLATAEQLAGKLEGQIIEVTAKASDEGTLYGAISPAKVSSALKAKGFEVDKDQIAARHIKELGEHEVVVDLDHGLEARITLVVNAERS